MGGAGLNHPRPGLEEALNCADVADGADAKKRNPSGLSNGPGAAGLPGGPDRGGSATLATLSEGAACAIAAPVLECAGVPK